MKKIIVLCLTICTASYVFSQDNVSIHFGQSFTTFKYTSSHGGTDPNLTSAFRSGYGVNYAKVFHSGFFIRPELGYKNLGGQSVLNGQKIDWSLHYLDFNLGLGYSVHMGPVITFIGIAPYYSYMYKGGQTYGLDYFDLIANKAIKTADYGLNILGGVKYRLNEANSIFVEVRNLTGLMQLEPDSESGSSEKLYNRAMSFHLGFSFNIVSKNRAQRKSNF